MAYEDIKRRVARAFPSKKGITVILPDYLKDFYPQNHQSSDPSDQVIKPRSMKTKTRCTFMMIRPQIIPVCQASAKMKESARRTAHHNEPSRGTPTYQCTGSPRLRGLRKR